MQSVMEKTESDAIYEPMLMAISHCSTRSEIKVDCIRVSTAPVKAIIDDHIQHLFDAMLNSLRRSINNNVNSMDEFLTEAMETLSQRPNTVEEIGQANAKHAEFGQKKLEVSSISLCFPHLHGFPSVCCSVKMGVTGKQAVNKDFGVGCQT